jgi:hypothetical protein
MKTLLPAVLGLALLTSATGCHTRSVSDSGYKRVNFANGQTAKRPGHERKEISEADVIGMNRVDRVSENEIRRAFEKTHHFRVPKGSTIMLIQAGTTTPEQGMIREMSQHFKVIPYSGLPLGEESGTTPASSPEQASKALRLEAARAGAETIVCYWGNLEIAKEDLPTKTISWLPVLDVIIPDEAHDLRLRLKFALVEVKDGDWAVFNAQPYEARGAGTAYARAHSDQFQLNSIKKKAYERAVDQIVNGYAQ